MASNTVGGRPEINGSAPEDESASCRQSLPDLAEKGGFNLKTGAEMKKTSSVIFSLKEEVGILARALKDFKKNGVNLLHIESRSSKRSSKDYEFIVECDPWTGDLEAAVEALKSKVTYIQVIARNHQDDSLTKSVPWFPRRIKDLDQFANQILSYGAELEADHPGFKDPVYRERRKEFADIAFNYRHGLPLPKVTYTEEETQTWSV